MRKTILFFAAIFMINGLIIAQADNARLAEINKQLVKSDSLWTKGGALGLDLSQLALVNPKVGGGENRLAFGSITSFFANYNKKNLAWDNLISWQMAVQRLGSSDNPFTKNIDVLRFGTKAGYKFRDKMYAAVLGTFESLVLKTYNDFSLSSNPDNFVQASFLSPATITISPGIDYKFSDKLSFFLSPASYKSILVMDDDIAKLGVHGNPWKSTTDFENVKNELGANARALYKNTFMKKLVVASDLGLFYDYLGENQGFEFMDVIWINNFSYELFKGFSINLLLDTRWDKDIKTISGYENDDKKKPILVNDRWMLTEALFVKYTHIF
ncbi:MAG: DUF3078 domain-containing protein [Deltaproteobacteria bacterium]